MDANAERFKHDASTWLGGLTPEGRQIVADVLTGLGSPPKASNGHNPAATVAHDESVLVTRTPTRDLIVTATPPYVDVFQLMPLWEKLAFRRNVLVKGPKGVGKSLSVNAYCQAKGLPLVQVESSEDTKKLDLVGNFTLKGKETVFVLGALPTVIEAANEHGYAVLNIEELNALTPQVQKMLNAVTDFRKSVSIPQVGRTYRLREGAQLWVVGTMNPSVYGGTYDLNEDLKSRFAEVEIGYPPFEAEKKILKTVCQQGVPDNIVDQVIRFAAETRQAATGYALSTRDLVGLVDDVVAVGLNNALQIAACKFEGDDRATIITRIGSNFAGVSPKKYWGSST